MYQEGLVRALNRVSALQLERGSMSVEPCVKTRVVRLAVCRATRMLHGHGEPEVVVVGLPPRLRVRAPVAAIGAVLAFAIAVLALAPAAVAGTRTAGEAFGAPGARSWWAPATSEFVGTANSPSSRLYFTGYSGIVGAVLWPTPDTPNTTDLQFMIGDAAHTWTDEEKADTTHSVALADSRALIWRVTNTDRDGRYRLEKEIFTDPGRDTLVQRVTFTALSGTVGDYLLYPLYNPTISNSGDDDSGRAVSAGGGSYLEASDANGRASVLGASLAFVPGMRSSGFVGSSDLWTDLRDKRMDWTYDSATRGNVAQGGLLDWGSAAGQKSAQFTLVLSFGDSAAAAHAAAEGTLGSELSSVRSTYVGQWNEWANALDPLGGAADQEYYTAAMTIRAHKGLVINKSAGWLVWMSNPGAWSTRSRSG
jgi:glucoamylase